MPDSIARGLYGDLANLRDFTALDTERMDESLDLLIGGVHESELFLEKVKPHKERVRGPFNLVAGLRWLSAGMNKRDRAQLHAPLGDAFGGHPGRAVSILYNGESRENQSPAGEEYRNLRDAAYQVADRERILHWEIEFPHVMTGDNPGFDAIISNPPWDRIKLQERRVVGRHSMRPSIARLGPASPTAKRRSNEASPTRRERSRRAPSSTSCRSRRPPNSMRVVWSASRRRLPPARQVADIEPLQPLR